MLKRQNLLVTGGAGFIGANFVRYWLQAHTAPVLVLAAALAAAGCGAAGPDGRAFVSVPVPPGFAPLPVPHDDPFAYLAAVVRDEVDPAGSPSSLAVNLVVMEILDAALRSAREGRAVRLGDG